MASISLTDQAREIETRINGILSSFDVDSLPSRERELVALIKRQVTDARLDVRDYQYAETRDEQMSLAQEAKKRYEQIRRYMLKASEYNLFGAIDIAQLTAHIDQLISQLD
ncbi:MAG TPA: hypothetical protein VF733_02370 [Candidatus Saccharimonadales bacterium]